MTAVSEPASARAEPRSWTRWVAVSGLLIAEAMNLLDSTVTTVIAPVIRTDLGGPASSAQWIAVAYTLPFAIALVPAGRLGDAFGRRRVFAIGLLGFLAASVVDAAAPTLPVLLAARVFHGVAAGLVIPQTIGLIKASFRGPSLGRAFSLIGPVMGLTTVAGPVLGGALTQADVAGLSWRAVFLVNLPLGAVVAATVRYLPTDRAARKPGTDLVGIALCGGTAAAVIVPTIDTMSPGRFAWLVAPVLAAALIIHMRRMVAMGRDPVVEPTLFHGKGFTAALATSVGYFALSTGLVFAVVLYIQDGLGASVLTASLTVLPFSIGLAVSSLTAGQWLLPRTGPKLMLPGIGILAAGSLAGIVAGPAWIPVALAVAGVGGGLVTVPFFTAALARVEPHETGSAAGLLNSVQQLGATLGIAAFGTIYFDHSSRPESGLTIVFVGCLALCAVLAGTATRMLRPGRTE